MLWPLLPKSWGWQADWALRPAASRVLWSAVRRRTLLLLLLHLR
jgi:hypothetical protein